MQQEIRFATFNVCNLALPGVKYYDDQPPYSVAEYDAKVSWIAEHLDRLDADIIGFQEIFSQTALRDVLARTTKYRGATHIGAEPEGGDRLTPSVALISRFPLAANAIHYTELPLHLSVNLPDTASVVNRFTRPVLHAQIAVSAHITVHVFVCHLKSKRPDFRAESCTDDPDQADLGSLRSLFRRGAEALGMRRLVTDCLHTYGAPVVVMGDFNDIAGSVSTQLVMGGWRHNNSSLSTRLFECYRIQARRDPLRDVGYTHIHDGIFETVDHVLVSEHFNPSSPNAIGEVSTVVYLNDHVAMSSPAATDHGLVLVHIHIHPTDDQYKTQITGNSVLTSNPGI
jgi:endonuclease/exonuclease/phosphatase family metal-dependent hydrolase